MLKVIITRGIPCSGKSSWAKSFVSTNPNYVRVCRDDFRMMLDNYTHSKETESLVSSLRDYAIITALKSNHNIIVDETGFNSVFTKLVKLISKNKIPCEVSEKYFYIDLQEAINRNSVRDRKVPIDVIQNMFKKTSKKYVEKKIILNYENNINNDFIKKLHDVSLPKCILVDIDGTVSLFNSHERFLNEKAHFRNGYDASNADKDMPNIPVLKAIELFYNDGYNIIFASGREEKFKSQTLKFLNQHLNSNVKFSLFMRKDDDNRSDVLVKEDILKENILGKYYIYFAFDDRNKIVDFYRSLGINVWQVNCGDF